MNRYFAFGLRLFAVLYSLNSTQSAQLYDNGPPDKKNGSEMTHWIEADDFKLPEAARLNGVKFWNFEIAGFFQGTLVWQIYSDSGGNGPGLLLFSGSTGNLNHTATGFTVFGAFEEFVTTFDIPSVPLPRGTYWLALHNGPLSNNTSKNVFWEATANIGGTTSHANPAPYNGPWLSNASPDLPSDLAFQLSGVAAPRITAFEFNNGAPRISFTTAAGLSYRVEYKNELSDLAWKPVSKAETVFGTGNVVEIVDPHRKTATRPRRYYRVTLSHDIIAAPRITAFGADNQTPRISFTTTAGYYYRVEYRNNLDDAAWLPVLGAEIVVGTGDVIQVSDSAANVGSQTRRVYRVTLL